MIRVNERTPGNIVVTAVAALSFLVWTWTSYARWADFQYRSFDLAYYVQAIWQLIHGRFDVSVENVPLLGNHVEPIVFLFAPLFAIIRHPLVFVAVQNALLASMGSIACSIAKRLAFDDKRACLLAITILLVPATGYIALHEFHPEALTAPFLLLMLHARMTKSIGRHWLWFVAVLACKENMALLLTAYCFVLCISERDRAFAERCRWYLWPMCLAVIWFVVCTRVITPALNSGNIDYLGLYDRIGTSPGRILLNTVLRPQLIGHALVQSLTHGNLVWGLLFPFLGLPLLRPRWILIAAPILLQHLLSWRSSEWMIYFHYGAPLIPLFWMASVEAIASFDRWKLYAALSRGAPLFIIIACVIGEFWLGLLSNIVSRNADWFEGGPERARKNAFIARIPPSTSVVAPLPYLSHLAMREKLYSLHYILKGLKTLSRSSYQPPPATDFVLIDYRDTATFDPSAGFYHPKMKTTDGRIIPSSERLLHDFLVQATWAAESQDELTLLRNNTDGSTALGTNESSPGQTPVFTVGAVQLLAIDASSKLISPPQSLQIHFYWKFQGERDVFPWMLLRLSRDQQSTVFVKGLCAPEVRDGIHLENWSVTTDQLAPGQYALEALFFDNSKEAWSQALEHRQTANLLAPPVPLVDLKVKK